MICTPLSCLNTITKKGGGGKKAGTGKKYITAKQEERNQITLENSFQLTSATTNLLYTHQVQNIYEYNDIRRKENFRTGIKTSPIPFFDIQDYV